MFFRFLSESILLPGMLQVLIREV